MAVKKTYNKPALKQFGTFQRLTQTGFIAVADNAGHPGVAGSSSGSQCHLLPGGVFCPAQS